MRLDPILGKHISKTSFSINDQVNYLERYKNSKPLGCIRIYNPEGTCFEWESWLIKKGLPQVDMESLLMMCKYALKFESTHFVISNRKKIRLFGIFIKKLLMPI